MSRYRAQSRPSSVTIQIPLMHTTTRPGTTSSDAVVIGTLAYRPITTKMSRLCRNTTRFRHTTEQLRIVYGNRICFIRLSPLVNARPPSVTIVETRDHVSIPAQRKGRYVLGSWFQRLAHTIPSAEMKTPRLSVVQNTPMTVRR